jgi:hypothetical protein
MIYIRNFYLLSACGLILSLPFQIALSGDLRETGNHFPSLILQQEDGKRGRAREAICQQVPCRPATTIKLKINTNEFAEFDFPKGPYVADGYINLLNGEEVNVEFTEDTDGLLKARYVEKVNSAEKIVTFKLVQTDDGTILSVKNPFGKNILYDCLIQHYQETRLRKTRIIPVESGLIGFEIWPYPITQVVISNIRYVAK